MRRNKFGQPLITQELRDQLWDYPMVEDALRIKQAQKQLEYMGLPPVAPVPQRVYQASLQLPKQLRPDGEKTLKERLESVVGGHIKPIKDKAQALVDSNIPRFDMTRFTAEAGWVRYAHTSEDCEAVPYPEEDAVIDYETMVKFGGWPVMAAAASKTAWYIWLHPSLTKVAQPFYGALVPTNPKGQLYFAWNAGFDRSQSSSSYLLDNTDDTWLDGMAFHMGSFGLSSGQRKAWEFSKEWAPWARVASPKSLLEAANLHAPHLNLTKQDKALRDIFVDATSISLIRNRLIELVKYCAEDVYVTHQLLKILWPRFLIDNPSPLSLAGMIQLGQSLLPVPAEWPEWVSHVEEVYEEATSSMHKLLTQLAYEVAKEGHRPDCPWTGAWNWEPAKSGKNAGQPHWLRTKVLAKGKKLGPRSRLAPALLKLRWQGQPIFHNKEYGWVYFGPAGTGERLLIDGQPAWRVPHEKGDDVNVGSPLAKGYIEHYENGLMGSENSDAKKILDEAAAVSYWTSVRERVIKQKAPLINGHRWIVPQLENYGTTTRRAVEPLWLTVASAKKTKIGSELKGMVRPPAGYSFVSADFSS